MNDFSYKRMKETGEIPPEAKKNLEYLLKVLKYFNHWLNEQEKRYNSVRDANEAFMKERGMKLPPEFYDFFDWYADKFEMQGVDFWDWKIEDIDLEDWHHWRVQHNRTKAPAKKYNPSVKVCALSLAIAFQKKKINEANSGKKAIIRLADELFPFYNAAGVYDDWLLYKNRKLEKLEELSEYEEAFKLFLTNFE